MRPYPLFLHLEGAAVLIAGCGNVGLRKLRTLLPCGPERIDIVDPRPRIPGLEEFFAAPNVVHHTRHFAPADVEGKTLVFAATNTPEVNLAIIKLCRERGILCSSADNPHESDFFTPAQLHTDGLTIAVGTEGQSPALAAWVRRDLETWVTGRYTGLAYLLGRLRPALLALGLSQAENAEIFRALADSPLAEALAHKQNDIVANILTKFLPSILHARIAEIMGERGQ